jgi:hypothetical protein
MDHQSADFPFIKKDKQEVKAITRPYNFKLEKIFKEMIGSTNFEAYQKSGKLEQDLSLEKVKKYFPKLLLCTFDEIDFEEQDFDMLLSVCSFFLNYRKNAAVRRLQSDKEILASTLETMRATIASLQTSIYQERISPEFQNS